MKYILRTIEKNLYCISVWDMEDNILTFNVGNRRTILRVARDLNINIKGYI